MSASKGGSVLVDKKQEREPDIVMGLGLKAPSAGSEGVAVSSPDHLRGDGQPLPPRRGKAAQTVVGRGVRPANVNVPHKETDAIVDRLEDEVLSAVRTAITGVMAEQATQFEWPDAKLDFSLTGQEVRQRAKAAGDTDAATVQQGPVVQDAGVTAKPLPDAVPATSWPLASRDVAPFLLRNPIRPARRRWGGIIGTSAVGLSLAVAAILARPATLNIFEPAEALVSSGSQFGGATGAMKFSKVGKGVPTELSEHATLSEQTSLSDRASSPVGVNTGEFETPAGQLLGDRDDTYEERAIGRANSEPAEHGTAAGHIGTRAAGQSAGEIGAVAEVVGGDGRAGANDAAGEAPGEHVAAAASKEPMSELAAQSWPQEPDADATGIPKTFEAEQVDMTGDAGKLAARSDNTAIATELAAVVDIDPRAAAEPRAEETSAKLVPTTSTVVANRAEGGPAGRLGPSGEAAKVAALTSDGEIVESEARPSEPP
ncbi:MAG: hypothetical protein V3V97_15655, partial [Hyphomicrobiaceae bacterium]